MTKFNFFLKNAFDKKIDGTGLAIFRIAYSLVLLCEIAQLFYFNHLIFDTIPFVKPAEIIFEIPISIWFVSVVFILFGAFTRFFTILNYLMGLILIGSITTYEYHVFYAYMGINFLLMFMPVSQCLSIDRLRTKLKYSNTTFQYNPPKTVSQLFYFLPLFVGIGLVYFDSVFLKLGSRSWQTGLGMWVPASMPMMVHNNLSFILNSKYLMVFLGYLTLAFEAFFLFIFFRKKWRILTFVIGTGFHIGILIIFPIPWFALTVIAIYLLLLPVSWWQKLFSSTTNSNTLTFYYDTQCPLCIRTKIVINHLDWFSKVGFKTVQFEAEACPELMNVDKDALLNDVYSINSKGRVYSGVDTYIQVMQRIFYLAPVSLLLRIPGVYHLAKKTYNFIAANRNTERCTEENCGYNPPIIQDAGKVKIFKAVTLLNLKYAFIKYLILSLFVIQVIIIYNSPVAVQIKEVIGCGNTKVDTVLTQGVKRMKGVTKVLFGSTAHSVFLDFHYVGYNHIIAIVYQDKNGKEIWLPLIDKNGQPSYYNYGTNWRKMSFSTNSPYIGMGALNSGVRDFTAFWSIKNKSKVDFTKAKFLIKVKKIDSLKNWNWEKDFLNKQIAKPWIEGGYVEWKDMKFTSHIKDIESL